jgi:hypothetical protein
MIEAAAYVGFHHLAGAPVWQVDGEVSDRIRRPSCRAIPITARQKLWLI